MNQLKLKKYDTGRVNLDTMEDQVIENTTDLESIKSKLYPNARLEDDGLLGKPVFNDRELTIIKSNLGELTFQIEAANLMIDVIGTSIREKIKNGDYKDNTPKNTTYWVNYINSRNLLLDFQEAVDLFEKTGKELHEQQVKYNKEDYDIFLYTQMEVKHDRPLITNCIPKELNREELNKQFFIHVAYKLNEYLKERSVFERSGIDIFNKIKSSNFFICSRIHKEQSNKKRPSYDEILLINFISDIAAYANKCISDVADFENNDNLKKLFSDSSEETLINSRITPAGFIRSLPDNNNIEIKAKITRLMKGHKKGKKVPRELFVLRNLATLKSTFKRSIFGFYGVQLGDTTEEVIGKINKNYSNFEEFVKFVTGNPSVFVGIFMFEILSDFFSGFRDNINMIYPNDKIKDSRFSIIKTSIITRFLDELKTIQQDHNLNVLFFNSIKPLIGDFLCLIDKELPKLENFYNLK